MGAQYASMKILQIERAIAERETQTATPKTLSYLRPAKPATIGSKNNFARTRSLSHVLNCFMYYFIMMAQHLHLNLMQLGDNIHDCVTLALQNKVTTIMNFFSPVHFSNEYQKFETSL